MNATRKSTFARWTKRVVATVVLVAAVSGIVLALLPQPVPVESTPVQRGPLVVTVNEDGVSRVNDRYVISSPLTGNLARIELEAGDAVKQGDVVARILPASSPLMNTRSRGEAEARVSAALAGKRQAAAQIERAQAALEFAQQEEASIQALVERKAANPQELSRARLERRSSEAELTSARFAAKVAQHELEMARAALGRVGSPGGAEGDQFEVTSPTDGIVLSVRQQSEGLVQAGTPLVEVGDPRALEIAVDVLTSDAVLIEPGATTMIEEWGGPPLSGTVRMVEPSAFTRMSALGIEEQRVNAVVDLTEPYERWKRLGDGYRVEAKIETYRNDEALLVPSSALFRRGADWAVFVIEAARAAEKDVEVGQRNEQHVEILSGLEPGQRVVLHPSDRVQSGSAVQVPN